MEKYYHVAKAVAPKRERLQEAQVHRIRVVSRILIFFQGLLGTDIGCS
jgi:hypothetical protein